MARNDNSDRTYRFVNRVFITFFGLVALQISVQGEDHLPTSGPGVIACNHTSYIDFTFVGYAARGRGRFIRFMCKRSIFNNRISGPLMRAMRHVPVDRPSGAVAYRQGLQRLADGELICTFPEATISHSFLLRPLKLGAAALALSQQVPLIPAIVWGSHRIATVDRMCSLRPGKAVSILFGEPIYPAPGDTRESLTAELRTRMDELLDAAIDNYPDRPRGDQDRWWLPHDRGGTAPDPETGARLDDEGLARIGELFD